MTIIIIVGLYFLLRATGRSAQKQRALEQARRKQELIYYERQRIAEQREAWRRQQAIAKAETQRQIAQERERIRRAQAAAKEAERRRKADFERQQAQTDLDNLDAIREGYMRLYDALEAEAQKKDTTEKRRLAIQRQLLTLDEKLYKLDAKRAKAYFVAVEGRAC